MMLLDAIKMFKENDLEKLIYEIEKDVFFKQNTVVYYVHNALKEHEKRKKAEKEYNFARKLFTFICFCSNRYDYVSEIPFNVESQFTVSRL